jgi:hypothetical protein
VNKALAAVKARTSSTATVAPAALAHTPSKRIGAFDLLRGFFLLVVIIDHVELYPSGFDFITGRGQLWVSAAEGFFFLSGLLVGVVNRKKIAVDVGLVFKKLWSRAALLYFCSITLTLFFTAWAIAHGNPDSIKYAGATHLGWDTFRQTLELKYVYGWSDFLSYYVTFMVAAPFIMYMLKRKLWWLVIGLIAFIWLNRGINFNQAWQVLFFGGMMAGYYWHNIQDVVAGWSKRTRDITWRTVVWAAGITVMISYLNLFALDNLHNHLDALTPWFATFIRNWDRINEAIWPFFNKFTLEPGRILMFLLWFSAAFLIINRYSSRMPKWITWTLNLLGQNSLYVYGTHSVVAFAVHAYLSKTMGFAFNFAITLLVIGIMIAITHAKNLLKQRQYAHAHTGHASLPSATAGRL